MRVFAVALLALGSLLFAQARKGKSPRPAEVAVVELRVQREPGHVTLDGRVKNTSEKPLKGLIVIFEFLASRGEPLTRQQTQVVDGMMESGEEGSFHVQTVDPVRAIWIRVEAQDSAGRELRVDKPGPYVIE
jgi:hypothetical protein